MNGWFSKQVCLFRCRDTEQKCLKIKQKLSYERFSQFVVVRNDNSCISWCKTSATDSICLAFIHKQASKCLQAGRMNHAGGDRNTCQNNFTVSPAHVEQNGRSNNKWSRDCSTYGLSWVGVFKTIECQVPHTRTHAGTGPIRFATNLRSIRAKYPRNASTSTIS